MTHNILVLGAGQLARMMALEALPLNLNVRAFDVRSNQVVNPLATGQTFGDLHAGIEFADVITAEFEHISDDVLKVCQASGKLKPTSTAIKTGGDRRIEKAALEQCGVANAKHHIVQTQQDFEDAIAKLSLPIIFKSALDGYDGKGQWRLKSMDNAQAIWAEMAEFIATGNDRNQGIVAEQMVPFDREVSLIGVRTAKGETLIYPLTENHHSNGILSLSIAQQPQPKLAAQAKDIFDKLADTLEYVGVLAVELFQVGDHLLVNEIAPRVHNSGHWTQQGADTSQFNNHIRAVAGLALGDTNLTRPTAMINIIGTDDVDPAILQIAGVHIHWYGKEARPGRKMGHINVCSDRFETLPAKLKQVASMLSDSDFADVKALISAL
ncbi:5-(carboxyamino)imidazole ribonucleotide synthase [Paraferrimonas sp. SM1919]|uniref:5-(carboxyamino)imidazole ribonucleotide synthase n=1 Tax=Paraferrimonas sp. SM1919 TaxID=2662263 RepID=UPI0013D509CE|nr:5-(carboxyamino)imidazole ribonucleotide synthase [Paraferrimonas sp. SM1919]